VAITEVIDVLPTPPAGATTLHAADVAVVRKSCRLAGKEPAMYLDMTTKAVKLRELKESLKTCSSRLQDHVKKNKLLIMLSPMGKKTASAIKAAAFGKLVPSGADD
jgi:hypothetical protein